MQILKILHKYWKFNKDIENIEFCYKTKNTHLPQVKILLEEL